MVLAIVISAFDDWVGSSNERLIRAAPARAGPFQLLQPDSFVPLQFCCRSDLHWIERQARTHWWSCPVFQGWSPLRPGNAPWAIEVGERMIW